MLSTPHRQSLRLQTRELYHLHWTKEKQPTSLGNLLKVKQLVSWKSLRSNQGQLQSPNPPLYTSTATRTCPPTKVMPQAGGQQFPSSSPHLDPTCGRNPGALTWSSGRSCLPCLLWGRSIFQSYHMIAITIPNSIIAVCNLWVIWGKENFLLQNKWHSHFTLREGPEILVCPLIVWK